MPMPNIVHVVERSTIYPWLVTGSTEPRWLDDEEQRTWRAYLLGSARLNEKLDDDLRRHGVDLGEYEILVTLSESEDRRVRMSELADAVHQSRSRLTHTITRMETRGLVERTIHGLDENVIVISHDLALIADFDRVLLFHEGRLTDDGAPAEVIARYRELAA